MKIRFIEAGDGAQTYARHFVRRGQEVFLSNSKGPNSLPDLVHSIGPQAKAGTVEEAARQAMVM